MRLQYDGCMGNNTIKHRGDAPLGELNKYPRNPRRGNVAAIKASMDALGQYKPIVVNIGTLTGRPNEILAGNHTYQAAKDLGWATISAAYVDVDDDTAAKIVLADNRTSDLATYDPEELLQLVSGITDLTGTGYTPNDLGTLTDDVKPAAVDVNAGKTNLEGKTQFKQRNDWEEREVRGMMLDYDLDGYWEVRDLFDAATKRHGTTTPAETLVALVEGATGTKAPRP